MPLDFYDVDNAVLPSLSEGHHITLCLDMRSVVGLHRLHQQNTLCGLLAEEAPFTIFTPRGSPAKAQKVNSGEATIGNWPTQSTNRNLVRKVKGKSRFPVTCLAHCVLKAAYTHNTYSCRL